MNSTPLAELSEKLAELEQRLATIKTDISKSHSPDSAEQAQERENDEVLEEIGRETEAAIVDTRLALARVQEGTYGQCVSCGEKIDADRLQIIPETIRCLPCAEEHARD